MIRDIYRYSALAHVPTCATWPPTWLAESVQPTPNPSPEPSPEPSAPTPLSPSLLSEPPPEPRQPPADAWDDNRAAVALDACQRLLDGASPMTRLHHPNAVVEAKVRGFVPPPGNSDPLPWDDQPLLRRTRRQMESCLATSRQERLGRDRAAGIPIGEVSLKPTAKQCRSKASGQAACFHPRRLPGVAPGRVRPGVLACVGCALGVGASGSRLGEVHRIAAATGFALGAPGQEMVLGIGRGGITLIGAAMWKR